MTTNFQVLCTISSTSLVTGGSTWTAALSLTSTVSMMMLMQQVLMLEDSWEFNLYQHYLSINKKSIDCMQLHPYMLDHLVKITSLSSHPKTSCCKSFAYLSFSHQFERLGFPRQNDRITLTMIRFVDVFSCESSSRNANVRLSVCLSVRKSAHLFELKNQPNKHQTSQYKLPQYI